MPTLLCCTRRSYEVHGLFHSTLLRHLCGCVCGRCQTMLRPRGYGLGNGINSKPFETSYYTQPGMTTDPRHTGPAKEVRYLLGLLLCLALPGPLSCLFHAHTHRPCLRA